jgi:hypothetical protein
MRGGKRTMPTHAKNKPQQKPKMSFAAAAKKEGYLKKGAFKPLPKKGSVQYNTIVKHMTN